MKNTEFWGAWGSYREMGEQSVGPIVAIMNAKGGVGKSTTTVMLAEALAVVKRKRVLVVDADPQGNTSLMLLGSGRLQVMSLDDKQKRRSLADYIEALKRPEAVVPIGDFLVVNATDLVGEPMLHLLPGSVKLAFVEREIHNDDERDAAGRAGRALQRLRQNYDYILIDCPPSVSRFTECWLRHADFHLSPCKPDLLSMAGLKLMMELKDQPSKGQPDFARQLGTLITMRRGQDEDARWVEELRAEKLWECFKTEIPLSVQFQRVAYYSREPRTFEKKYPRHHGLVKQLADEFMERCAVRALRTVT